MHDFLYRDELEDWRRRGILTRLSLAWSRAQNGSSRLDTHEGEKRLKTPAPPHAFLVKRLKLKNFSHDNGFRDYCKKGREGFTFGQPGY